MRTENEQQIAMIGEDMNRRFCVEQIIKAREDLVDCAHFFLEGTPSQLCRLESRTLEGQGGVILLLEGQVQIFSICLRNQSSPEAIGCVCIHTGDLGIVQMR